VIHQDVDLYAANLSAGESVSYTLNSGRAAWLQVARGAVQLNDRTLTAGDGAAITAESAIALEGIAPDGEVLLFDMAA
jgi:redox-sensitive bicupin YhaK (pirin superfamily)